MLMARALQQDFFGTFSEQMATHMQQNPVTWADCDMINSFHQSAVQEVCEDNSLSSLQRQLGGQLYAHIDFSLLDSSTGGASIDIATMNCVHFAFSVQQPLRVLFSTSIMHKYSRLGVLLVQVKAVESVLVKVQNKRVETLLVRLLTCLCKNVSCAQLKSTLRHRRCYTLYVLDSLQALCLCVYSP